MFGQVRLLLIGVAFMAVTGGAAVYAADAAPPAEATDQPAAAPAVTADAKPESAKEADKATARVDEREALLKIRFNQHRVYFERSVEQAVEKAREVKSKVVFDVVSIEPPLSADANRRVEDRSRETYLRNTMEVVGAIERQGVSGALINTRSETSDTVKSQEIHIFVR